jgi:hypothetical protein
MTCFRSGRAALIPILLLAIPLAGCGRAAPRLSPAATSAAAPAVPAAAVEPEPAAAAVPPSFAAQVAAVRDGTSRRVVATTPPTAAEWASLRGLGGLRELVVERGGAGDGEAEVFATLADLERLVLRHCPLGDAGFRRLASCRSLRDLNVPQAACTTAGVRALAPLENLRSLRLGAPGLAGPEVCEAVTALPRLRSLHLIDVPIGDAGLAILGRMPGLWNLYLDGAGVSDAAWAGYFEACPTVHVHVDQAHHDRDPRGDHP